MRQGTPGPNAKTPIRHGRLTIFTNDWLEAFFRSPPVVPFVWGGVALALLFERFTLGVGSLLPIASGWVAWSLLEYVMHRFWFHARREGDAWRGMLFLVHGHHHAYPNDEGRLVATWWQSASALLLLGWLLGAVWPEPEAAWFGLIAGYLAYEAVHYRIHHGRTHGPWMKALRRHHLRHHHRPDPAGPYGIGSRLFDWVFRSS